MTVALERVRPARRPVRRGWLTAPELAVVDLVADGLTNEEVGARLMLSPKTVKRHLARVSQRSGCTLREGIVGRAYRLGELRRRPVEPAGAEVAPVRVTARQYQVLVLVGRGFSTEEICVELGVVVHTAKTHVARLFGVFGARNRAHLVRLAVDAGVLRLVPTAPIQSLPEGDH